MKLKRGKNHSLNMLKKNFWKNLIRTQIRNLLKIKTKTIIDQIKSKN